MNYFKENYPFIPVNYDTRNCPNQNNKSPQPMPAHKDDERFGFLLPFITGVAISAPFWYIAGSNKTPQPVYPAYPQPYYQQPYYPQPYQQPYQQPYYQYNAYYPKNTYTNNPYYK